MPGCAQQRQKQPFAGQQGEAEADSAGPCQAGQRMGVQAGAQQQKEGGEEQAVPRIGKQLEASLVQGIQQRETG